MCLTLGNLQRHVGIVLVTQHMSSAMSLLSAQLLMSGNGAATAPLWGDAALLPSTLIPGSWPKWTSHPVQQLLLIPFLCCCLCPLPASLQL